jgi:hypothetical protein
MSFSVSSINMKRITSPLKARPTRCLHLGVTTTEGVVAMSVLRLHLFERDRDAGFEPLSGRNVTVSRRPNQRTDW